MADKPSKGLADVIAASTALSDIDGRAGLLSYRWLTWTPLDRR
jgi:citrate synthase